MTVAPDCAERATRSSSSRNVLASPSVRGASSFSPTLDNRVPNSRSAASPASVSRICRARRSAGPGAAGPGLRLHADRTERSSPSGPTSSSPCGRRASRPARWRASTPRNGREILPRRPPARLPRRPHRPSRRKPLIRPATSPRARTCRQLRPAAAPPASTTGRPASADDRASVLNELLGVLGLIGAQQARLRGAQLPAGGDTVRTGEAVLG
jgi:hypothetical protein